MLFWGKERSGSECHLLPFHCLDVAAVFAELVDADAIFQARLERAAGTPLADILPLLLFLASIHDLGKFSLPFQWQKPELAEKLGVPEFPYHVGYGVSHRTLGYGLWRRGLKDVFKAEPFNLTRKEWSALDILAQAVFCHHGRPEAEQWDAAMYGEAGEHALAFCRQMAALHWPEARVPELDKRAWIVLSWLYAGLLVLADWIGSNTLWFPLRGMPMDYADYYSSARKRARTAVAESGVLLPPVAGHDGFAGLLPHLADKEPTPLQAYALLKAVTDGEPQLHIFEDLTGKGKTEAALLCAHGIMANRGAGGVYEGMPTMATANAMYARMARSYKALFTDNARASLMLAHSASKIHDEFLASIALENQRANAGAAEEPSEALCAAWLADNRKKALLAPFGVGTLDQALLAALPVRHQCLRLLGLCRSVLIADEVHAYDSYTFELLCNVLRFQAALGSSAVVLTATLPRAMRLKLCNAFNEGLPRDKGGLELHEDRFPLATKVTAAGVEEQPVESAGSLCVSVCLTTDVEDMYKALVRAREVGACACWVRNTVNLATESFGELKARGVPESDLLLFHARFAQCDRLNIEARVMKLFGKDSTPEQRAGKILVATQVMEQSIDCDFDLLLSDLAPMELMIQRAGRGHRHERARPSGYEDHIMLVLSPEHAADPHEGWYRDVFGDGAAYVYPRPAVLWRTAGLLEEKEGLVLPRDARELLERAYDPSDTPENLEAAEQKALGDSLGGMAMADWARLLPDQGYGLDATMSGWHEDVRMPTRLGEETVSMRLCRVEGENVRLWAGPGTDAKTCMRSEVRVNAAKAKGVPVEDGHLASKLEAFGQGMPDACKWSLLLPLFPDGRGGWQGAVEDKSGRRVRVEYSAVAGLKVMD